MLAAGTSLAAHVSFGPKMPAVLANAFEFVGPVSGLVHALVKPTEATPASARADFKQPLSAPQPPALVVPGAGSSAR